MQFLIVQYRNTGNLPKWEDNTVWEHVTEL